LTQEQLAEAQAAVIGENSGQNESEPVSEAQPLADRLVSLGYLNPWQASQLLEGRARFTLGQYRIIDSLGKGGMGQVFLAHVGDTTQKVAVKVLPRDKATTTAVESFQREILAQSKLNHTNLVRALDAGFDGNVYYLVSEYIPGKNLRQLIRQEGPLPTDRAAWLIAQAAAGLGHAHRNGWIHRDVKPSNILVTPEGNAKLSDLGLAGPLTNGDDQTLDPCFNTIAGTADYLCPDQVRNPREPTPLWDIYSLGCTLYYAITGKVPFPGGTPAEKAKAHCEQMPLNPHRLVDGLSGEFVEVLILMLAKNPQERLPDTQTVIERLKPFFVPSKEKPLMAKTELSLAQETTTDTAAETRPSRTTGLKDSLWIPFLEVVVVPIVLVFLFTLFYFILS
jgi:serine/threonine protein kinase